jgi:hypothetical protein
MDSRPPDANVMMEYASLRLLAGDSAGYKRLCARLVERYGDTSDLGIVDNLSRVCTRSRLPCGGLTESYH